MTSDPSQQPVNPGRERELASLGVRPVSFLEEERAARRPVPKRLAGFVDDVLKKHQPARVKVGGVSPTRPDRQLDTLTELWAKTVGPGIAKVTKVTRYRGGILTVKVQSAAVRTELEFARAHLIDALAEQGLSGVHEIRFGHSASSNYRGGSRRTPGPGGA